MTLLTASNSARTSIMHAFLFTLTKLAASIMLLKASIMLKFVYNTGYQSLGEVLHNENF